MKQWPITHGWRRPCRVWFEGILTVVLDRGGQRAAVESVTLFLLLLALDMQILLGSSNWPAVRFVTVILTIKPVDMRPALGWHLTTLPTLGVQVSLFIKYLLTWDILR